MSLLATMVGGCAESQPATKKENAPAYAQQMANGNKPASYGQQYSNSNQGRSRSGGPAAAAPK
jgi:hypothetical protein